MSDTKPSVLIIGGGAFGCSTAYHLACRGYDSVRVLDRFEAPSHDAASTDLNKVVRADYPDAIYGRLGLEAMKVWESKTSFLKNLYRKCGWIRSASPQDTAWLKAAYKTGRDLGFTQSKWMKGEEIRSAWPEISGQLGDWENLWNPEAGWVPSAQALVSMTNAARKEGVEFTSGLDGDVRKLLYDDSHKCVGALSRSGKAHFADTIIVSTGAFLPELLEAKEESIAVAGCVGILKLTPAEMETYKNMPIVDEAVGGLLFPPDEHGMLKIVTNRGITNYAYSPVKGASVTHGFNAHPADGIPIEMEKRLRDFLREVLPELAEREFFTTRMCWDSSTKDYHYRICPFPETKNLYVATCGATHGFKMMPVIGKYVVDMLEDKLPDHLVAAWSWKSGKAPEGEMLYPHPQDHDDLGDLTGWKRSNRNLSPPSRALRANL
ncbi:unnamed protein product [Clonostachys solani]|uniref:FAD dependent oxidoreductase domain-containing protein n=1 Tax=Clonostachys solani TaxID=160281 RepID=A0A9N9Z088_9HYPO|nr:unnamed protein product [Clonostachys solani]